MFHYYNKTKAQKSIKLNYYYNKNQVNNQKPRIIKARRVQLNEESVHRQKSQRKSQ